MEKKGKTLLKFARQFSQEKFRSFFPKFHHSQTFYDDDHHQEDDTFKVDDDDWELIELLDQEFASDGDGDVDDNGLLNSDVLEAAFSSILSLASHNKTKFRILSKDDVRHLLEDKVSRVSAVHSLSRSEAVALLNHFNWRVSRVHEEWLTHEEKVRKAVGLFEKPVVETSNTNEIACSLCRGSRDAYNLVAISCGHQMCLTCLTEYISEAINSSPECLTLRCPEESCEAAVGMDLVELVSNQDDKKKFHNCLLQSFVTRRRKAKWCPAPDCEYAAIASMGKDANNNDVTCKCSHRFCWNCSEEAHAPIGCVAVREWVSEIDVQSNNWLLAKARPCPSCTVLIEEASCNIYAQCPLCDYKLRSATSSEDVSANEDTTPTHDDDNEYMRELAKGSLERFEQYYLGWSISEASRVNAVTELKVLKEIRLEILCFCLEIPPTELDFLFEAHTQAINFWQLLKWMHAYTYYVPEDEHLRTNLFDFMLEQAVKLVKMIEKHVDMFMHSVLVGEISFPEYVSHRENIIRLTRVTGQYYDRLVEAMKTELSQVVSISRASSSPKTDEDSSSSSPSTGPTREVIKTKGEEGDSSSPAVDRSSKVLIPGKGGNSSPREETEPNSKLE
ncbi:hypothetical protein vseg_011852 [Gypsophila vaccaria]